MKIDISTNLNWNNATVTSFNYIYYLARMVNERSNEIGISTTGTSSFNLANYEPGGFFRFQQLYDIYVTTIYLGEYHYLADDALSNDAFHNGHRVKPFSYTIDQLSNIADFDFSKHPLIPNQRLNYYDQFLKPLYLVLKEYKKIWINLFYAIDKPKLKWYYNNPNNDMIEVNHIMQHVTGQDKLDYYSYDHAMANGIEIPTTGSFNEHDMTFLGGLMNADKFKFYSFGYSKTKNEGGQWVYDGTQYDYASNFEGLKFNYYLSLHSTQIQCPVPLVPGADYDLYMYSFTYPVCYANDTPTVVHGRINDHFLNRIVDLRDSPSIFLQPFGNYFKVDSGTIQHNFNKFDISLPEELPYDDTIFNNYPMDLLGTANNYQNVDYEPYSYDTNLWTPNGSTPSRDYHDHYDLTPGKYLRWIGPRGWMNSATIEWWYKPLLIVDYSSKFHFD